jgi:hypothetical protein
MSPGLRMFSDLTMLAHQVVDKSVGKHIIPCSPNHSNCLIKSLLPYLSKEFVSILELINMQRKM